MQQGWANQKAADLVMDNPQPLSIITCKFYIFLVHCRMFGFGNTDVGENDGKRPRTHKKVSNVGQEGNH